jgi:hypothetical protein
MVDGARVDHRDRPFVLSGSVLVGTKPHRYDSKARRGLELVLHRQRRVRTRMIALNGNAIAGDLLEVFGA